MPQDRAEDRHKLNRHSIGFEDEVWDELLAVTGSREERHELFRRFAAAFLGRPKARMPRRRDYEQG